LINVAVLPLPKHVVDDVDAGDRVACRLNVDRVAAADQLIILDRDVLNRIRIGLKEDRRCPTVRVDQRVILDQHRKI
jgi:hypothetical protein